MNLKFRALIIDLLLLVAIAFISEWMNAKALSQYYSGFYFSITMIIPFIAIFRWRYFGMFVSVAVSIITLAFMNGATMETWLIYVFGSIGMLGACVYLELRDKRKWVSSGLVYTLSGYVPVICLRALVFYILGQDFLSAILIVGANEMLNVIAITMFVTLLMKRKNSVMVNIKSLYDGGTEHV